VGRFMIDGRFSVVKPAIMKEIERIVVMIFFIVIFFVVMVWNEGMEVVNFMRSSILGAQGDENTFSFLVNVETCVAGDVYKSVVVVLV